jgi:hypothetical protein
MDTKQDHERAVFKIENEAGRFPAQMLLIPNLFEFSFEEYRALLTTAFSSNAELLAALRKTADFVQDSDIDAELKNDVIHLIKDEMEVVAFSQSARCSVISM